MIRFEIAVFSKQNFNQKLSNEISSIFKDYKIFSQNLKILSKELHSANIKTVKFFTKNKFLFNDIKRPLILMRTELNVF